MRGVRPLACLPLRFVASPGLTCSSSTATLGGVSLPELSPAAPDSRSLRIVDQVVRRYGLIPEQVDPVGTSALNTNFRVDAGGRRFFVCIYRSGLGPERVAAAERMAQFAAAAGIPAPLPIEESPGKTVHVVERRLVCMFPWVEAAPPPQRTPDIVTARRLGEVLGRLHAVLSRYQDPALRKNGSGSDWETDGAADVLSRVDDLIRYYPSPPPWQQEVQRTLRRRLDLLESGAALPRSTFDGLAVQPVHGDFHDGNVLFDGNASLAAVVDWDMCGRLSPAFELLRAISFSHVLDEPRAVAFLRGYRSESRLVPGDCEPAVEMWWQAQLHDTWAFRERFIEGNRAVDPCFADDARRLETFADAAYRARLAGLLREHAT